MYIRFNTITKRVVYVGAEKPINIEDGTFQVAQVESVPSEYDWLTYENGVLIPHFVVYTEEQLKAQKQEKYESLVEIYIREKYSLSNEIAILRQASTKVEEFNAYNLYAEQCKARAKAEVYWV